MLIGLKRVTTLSGRLHRRPLAGRRQEGGDRGDPGGLGAAAGLRAHGKDRTLAGVADDVVERRLRFDRLGD
jgi:hypothetical protein